MFAEIFSGELILSSWRLSKWLFSAFKVNQKNNLQKRIYIEKKFGLTKYYK